VVSLSLSVAMPVVESLQSIDSVIQSYCRQCWSSCVLACRCLPGQLLTSLRGSSFFLYETPRAQREKSKTKGSKEENNKMFIGEKGKKVYMCVEQEQQHRLGLYVTRFTRSLR
jgi:hypothetical protein